MTAKVSIPGKAMLSGEYAVLFGGTAALVPVSRFLEVAETPAAPRSQSPVVQAALDLQIPELSVFENLEGKPDVAIESSGFRDGGTNSKLGIGQSAAEAVGVIALRFERAGIPWQDNRDVVANYAFVAHRKAQGNVGSGADIAACAYGVPIYYQLLDHGPIAKPVTGIPRRCIPMHLVWSGDSADTRLLVSRFESWAGSGGKAASNLVQRLVAMSKKLAPYWFTASSSPLYSYMAEYMVLLNRCLGAAGIPYLTEGCKQLIDWAVANGGKAKPVGAGGGDMVLLIGNLPIEELSKKAIEITPGI